MRVVEPLRTATFEAVPDAAPQLTRRAVLNALAAGVDLVARVVVELILNPLLVGRLGDHLFGVWRVLWRFTGSLSAAGGRSAQALKWSVASRQTSTDYVAKRELVGSALGVWALFLPILALLGGVFAWFSPALLDTPAPLHTSVRWAAALLVAHVMFSGLVDVPRAVLQGENLGYKRLGLSTALVLFGGVLVAGALYLGTGIVGVAAANVVNTLLTGALFARVVRSHVHWAGIVRPRLAAVWGFARLSAWFMVWKFVMQALVAGDVVVLGLVDSAESVTTYALTRFAPELVLAMVALLVAGLAPGLGRLVGAQHWERAARVRNELMASTWLLVTSAGTTLLVWNAAFMDLWVGPGYFAGAIPGLVIVVMVAQFALIRNDANVIDLTLTMRRKVLIGLASAVLSLSLAAVVLGPLEGGIAGMCLAVIAGRIPMSIVYPLHVATIFGQPWHGQLRAALRPGLTTTLLFAAALSLSGGLAVPGWPALIGWAGVTFLASAVAAFWIGLASGVRAILLRRLHMVIRLVY